MNDQKETKVKFLEDSPQNHDDLKLHENIAKTIKRIINLTKDSKKKVIGLFGSWGSGKSTIIEILKRDEFFGKDNIFVFDSWSHKGDFLKRAFLLELAKKLKVEGEKYEQKENKEENKENKNILTIRTVLTRKIVNKIVDFTPISHFNKHIKILSLILILSIITIAISNIIEYFFIPFIPKHIILKWENFDNNWIVGIILVIIALCIYIYNKKAIKKTFNDFINFYFLKKTNITESHTTKENLEFTNYDYEEYLEYILKKANDKNKLKNNEPFIIVFDNLDRVSNETVLNTLSLIQLTNEVLNCSVFKQIYFLIPIDKERLEKTIKTIVVNRDVKEDNKFSKDFIKKIFPYKVNIPDLIHSEWRKFFVEKLKDAFGSLITEDELSFIRRVFETSIRNSEEKNLTPREIKNFINNLVENYLYWENLENKPDIKIQSVYVALFTYFEDELKNWIHKKLKLNENEKTNNSNNSKKNNLNKIINIAKEEYTEKEVTEILLKQYYKVEEIYTLFIEVTIESIENEDIDAIQKIINIFKDKNKVDQLFEEIIEQKKEEFAQDINLLLQYFKTLNEIGLYSKYKNKIRSISEKSIKNINSLLKLKNHYLEELKSLLQSSEELEKLFIEKSIEIIVNISEETNNET